MLLPGRGSTVVGCAVPFLRAEERVPVPEISTEEHGSVPASTWREKVVLSSGEGW